MIIGVNVVCIYFYIHVCVSPHHCMLSICIFSFTHFDLVGRVLALIALVSGHLYDFS